MSSLPWLTLAGLGLYHGINPAMGWLFAVSRGMQHGNRRAVLDSLVPIAVGHELSLVAIAAVLLGAEELVAPNTLHYAAAGALLAFGIFRFVKPRAHFRWTSMNVNRRELTLWSFLMSTAHGAGLMVAPVLLGIGASDAAAAVSKDDHEHVEMIQRSLPADVLGLMLHVGVMLAVMGVIAVVVYERLGVEVLRRAWVNTDQAWAAAFVVAAGITLFVT